VIEQVILCNGQDPDMLFYVEGQVFDEGDGVFDFVGVASQPIDFVGRQEAEDPVVWAVVFFEMLWFCIGGLCLREPQYIMFVHVVTCSELFDDL
jgi:hypothetical protein